MQSITSFIKRIDWIIVGAALPLVFAGILTMSSFVSENYFAPRQFIWLGISLLIFVLASFVDWRFLRRSGVVTTLYILSLLSLVILFFLPGVKGVHSWINLGFFTFQPADLAKLVLIIVLAKYFTRRHVEIAHIRHIVTSGIYALIMFGLILLQPDFGSALVIFIIWMGMIIVSGVSKRHLFGLIALGIITAGVLWTFVFADYQKNRILTFIDPLSDIQGAGYNAFQSQIAVGSGELWGKGVGYGTQSRLEFLPEYETDFIFAAFAEEWGFAGVIILFGLFSIIIWRVLTIALVGASNFEIFFGLGLAIMFMGHFVIHIGMNIGLLPVTGIPLTFVSYGGSHLIIEFLGLGMLVGMRGYSRVVHKEDTSHEFLGVGT